MRAVYVFKGLLTVHLTVSEPAMIRLEILKNGNLRRQMTLARTSVGSFAAQISLRKIKGN